MSRRSTPFGPWKFFPDNLTLVHSPTGYEIDLEEIDTSAQMLDWIFQVQNKTWATPDVLYGLLAAFRTVMNPQANYCSMGCDKPASGSDVAKRFRSKISCFR